MKTLLRIFTGVLAFTFGFPSLRAQDPYPLRASLFPAPTTPQAGAQHGYSVAVDGDYVVVGAPTADVSAGAGRGVAIVYHATSGALVARLYHPSPGVGYSFGISVAVSGNRVVVGAYDAAYVYDLSGAAPATPVAALHNPRSGVADYFGFAVAISGDRVIVSASRDDAGAMTGGRAYVYDLASATPTLPVTILENPGGAPDARFGASVAISGNRVVVGALLEGNGANNAGAAYVYDLGSATPTVPAATLDNPDPSQEDYFGASVAVSGSRVVVGTPGDYDDTGGPAAGVAYVYDLGSGTPTLPVTTLHSPSPSSYNGFGISVAVSGEHVVVGEYVSDPGVNDVGAARVFDLGSTTPAIPVLTLHNPSPAEYADFGHAVAVAGNRVVVGQVSPVSDDDGPTDAGSAYLYHLGGATPMVPVAKLKNPTPPTDDEFGLSVAVSGNLVVVGALADDTGAVNAGAACVFDMGSATPTVPVAVLHSPNPTAYGYFGGSVAVSGNRVAVGAFADDTGAMNAGAVHIYDLGSAAPTVPVITLPNPNPSSYDYFGRSVALSGDRLVVGAIYAAGVGAAYVYDLGSASPTMPVATLHKPNPAFSDLFGYSVAISGTRVVVGAMNDDTGARDAGSAYVYELGGATPAVPVAILNNPSPDADDQFGISVAVSAHLVAVGARYDHAGAPGAGSAFVYDLDSATPSVPVTILHYPSPAGYDGLAASVAMSGNRVVVGVSGDDTGVENSGAAYVYDLDGATPALPAATLHNPTPGNFDYFGSGVAVSGNRVIVGSHLDDTLNTDEGAAYIFGDPLTVLTRLESWRLAHFGSIGNSGPGADLGDFEHDGLGNLLEFATHRDPTRADGGIVALSKTGGVLNFTYRRANAAVLDGLGFQVEWTAALESGMWSSAGIAESILSDDGIAQEILATIPADGSEMRFVRLRVSRPPMGWSW